MINISRRVTYEFTRGWHAACDRVRGAAELAIDTLTGGSEHDTTKLTNVVNAGASSAVAVIGLRC